MAASPVTTPLRERKRQDTRRRILEACVEIELLHGAISRPELFTYAKVAEVADVSERTVYRMFPTKQDLDRAYVGERVLTAGMTPPADLAKLPDNIRALTKRWDEHFGGARVRRRDDATGAYPASTAARARRDAAAVAGVRAAVGPELPERQVLALAALVNAVGGIRPVVATAERWGLTLAEAGEVHSWALGVIVHALSDGEVPPWTQER